MEIFEEMHAGHLQGFFCGDTHDTQGRIFPFFTLQQRPASENATKNKNEQCRLEKV